LRVEARPKGTVTKNALPENSATQGSATQDNRLTSAGALEVASLTADWRDVLGTESARASLAHLGAQIKQALDRAATIYPADPWLALRLTPLANVRVVILGQDPYHGPGQAQGLAFSVPRTCKAPPSLRNIFTEIDRDLGAGFLGLTPEHSNDLSHWARQGVLLLNTTLTVEDGQAASHAKIGWQVITDLLIAAVAKRDSPTVFMLWGAHAQGKLELIQTTGLSGKRLILQSNHPSPLSARRPPVPFIGCGHFQGANDWLKAHGQPEIAWR
jgi:uracil-DNA glycosylase